jgi:hypothetical protein
LKILENHAEHTQKVLIKMFRSPKKYPSRDTVPLSATNTLFQTADGNSIKLSQSDKWFKQAGIIGGKTLSTTDTGIAFRKVAKYASCF